MKKISEKELQKFLRKHKLWLEGDIRGERANLCRANLRGANLCRADLRWANLRGANLCEANLCEADLCEADLYIACPEKGSFIAFKKSGPDEGGNKYIIELEIPSEARRCSATSRKCRCDKALVLSITTLSGEKTDLMSIRSGYDSSFIYEVGKLVEEPNFNENRWDECSEGIHFFITRQEAVDY